MENTVIPIEDTFYIISTHSSADHVSRILKDGDTFAVCDRHGDIQAMGAEQEGPNHDGTRFLSHLLFRLGNARPFLIKLGNSGGQSSRRSEFDQGRNRDGHDTTR